MFEVLEFEISDGASREIEGQTGLVGLVNEVPHVDAVRFRDEDHARAGRLERSAGVVRPEGVRRTEDWLVELLHRSLPDTKVEIVNCQD